MPTAERAFKKRAGLTSKRCVARNRAGEPCGAYALAGGTQCRMHGGSVKATRAAAQRRIAHAVDAAAMRLLGFAFDEGVADSIALQAVQSVLDRGGLSAKTAVSLEFAPPAYTEVFDSIYNGPRFEGPNAPTPDQTQLEPAPEGPERPAASSAEVVGVVVPEPIVDAEVVDINETGRGLVDFETAVQQAAQVKRALGQFGPVRSIPPGRRR